MPADWQNSSPTDPPKQTEDESTASELGVLPEREAWPGLGEIPFGPKRVFKKGFPTGKTVRFTGVGMVTAKFEPTPMTKSKPSSCLDLHGVADSSRLEAVLHPANMSLMDSLVRQEAILITEDLKMIDISANAWPIDLHKAPDVRTQLKTPVRYGDEFGIVAGYQGDLIFFRSSSGTRLVPMQDVEVAPGKAVVATEDVLELGDEVATKDLSQQGKIIGIVTWDKGRHPQVVKVQWQPSGLETDVEAMDLVKAVGSESQEPEPGTPEYEAEVQEAFAEGPRSQFE